MGEGNVTWVWEKRTPPRGNCCCGENSPPNNSIMEASAAEEWLAYIVEN